MMSVLQGIRTSVWWPEKAIRVSEVLLVQIHGLVVELDLAEFMAVALQEISFLEQTGVQLLVMIGMT